MQAPILDGSDLVILRPSVDKIWPGPFSFLPATRTAVINEWARSARSPERRVRRETEAL
jgi:hypothetical protein